jgi:hypothetical protein
MLAATMSRVRANMLIGISSLIVNWGRGASGGDGGSGE